MLKDIIEVHCKNLKKAIKGVIVMSIELELIYNSLLLNAMPQIWLNYSFVSLKPLADWISDLKQRIQFFKSWMLRSKMDSYLLSSFFFHHVHV